MARALALASGGGTAEAGGSAALGISGGTSTLADGGGEAEALASADTVGGAVAALVGLGALATLGVVAGLSDGTGAGVTLFAVGAGGSGGAADCANATDSPSKSPSKNPSTSTLAVPEGPTLDSFKTAILSSTHRSKASTDSEARAAAGPARRLTCLDICLAR
jgi:hypothetical protein